MLDTKTIIIRLLLSVLLSGLIGKDRESTNKPAGLRTHVLVSLGSTLIMLLSIYNADIRGIENSDRLSAQVISGIGFLGAGTILRGGSGLVTGLTTAASLWIVAAIGLSVGAGFYIGAIFVTGLVYFVLAYFHPLESKINTKKYNIYRINILLEDRPGQMLEIDQVFEFYKIQVLNTKIKNENGIINIKKKFKLLESESKYVFLDSLFKVSGFIEIAEITKEEGYE